MRFYSLLFAHIHSNINIFKIYNLIIMYFPGDKIQRS